MRLLLSTCASLYCSDA